MARLIKFFLLLILCVLNTAAPRSEYYDDDYYDDDEGNGYSDEGDDDPGTASRFEEDEKIPAHIKEEIAALKEFDEGMFKEQLKLATVGGNVKFRKDAEGGFSKVMFRVMKTKDKNGKTVRTPVAIKMIRNADNLSDVDQYVDALDQAVNEWRVAKLLRNSGMYYAVKIHEAYRDKNGESIYIVMDYLNGKDVWSYVFERNIILTASEAVANAARIGEMLYKLKKAGIIYRDLKFENMIMNRQREIFMIDFGLAMIIKDEPDGYAHDFCGTVHTMAPEALSEQPQDYQVDVWSFGVVLYMLLTGNKFPHGPFGESDAPDEDFDRYVEDVLDNINEQNIDFPDKFFGSSSGRNAKRLIRSMLKPDPKERITMENVLQHAFFSDQGYYFDHLFNPHKRRNDKAKPPSATKQQPKDLRKDEHVDNEDVETGKRDVRHRGITRRQWSKMSNLKTKLAPKLEKMSRRNRNDDSFRGMKRQMSTIHESSPARQRRYSLRNNQLAPLPDEIELYDAFRKKTFIYVKTRAVEDATPTRTTKVRRVSTSTRHQNAGKKRY